MTKDENDKLEVTQITSLVESLLFVSNEPVPVSRLSSILNVPTMEIDSAIGQLAQEYGQRGLRIQRLGDNIQMTTAPENAPMIEKYLGLETDVRLTRPAMEVLAIVAILQPVTRPRIEDIRGVNSDSSLRTLMGLGLIEEIGRSETPGRPILYATTPDFLQHFGLENLEQLPISLTDEEE